MTAGLAGTPRYFAWLYAGETMQAVLKPLFGIESEIKAALQPGLEHSVAHVRMGWWGEEAQRLQGGHALHPLTRALLAQRPPVARAGADISGLVNIATWDLAAATFATRGELTGYCERWARAVTQLAASWGAPALPVALAEEFGISLGAALCELELLIGLQSDARLGRVLLPLDELAALGVPPDHLARTPWPNALCERLGARHQELRGALQTSCALLQSPAQRTALRGLLVWAALMQQHSRRAETALPGSWQRSRREGIGDALRAWRAAREAL